MMPAASVSRSESGSAARYLAHAPAKNRRASSRDGLNINSLGTVFAEIADDALRALGRARDANVAAVKNQPVVRIALELVRHELQKLRLDFLDGLSGRQMGAIADTEDVPVDGDRRLPERRVEHNVRGLAPDTRQLLQQVTVRRNTA